MKTLAVPALCWLSALAGLILALLTDGFGDGVALAALCAPWLLTAFYVARARRSGNALK